MKNNVYPCKPQFYCIKVGFKGVKSLSKLYRLVFVMVTIEIWLTTFFHGHGNLQTFKCCQFEAE